jgi:hypothetical protein
MPDPELETTRVVREEISHEHGNDTRRLIAHYMDYQRRFADRLRWAPGTGPAPEETAEDASLTDGTQHR